MSLRSGTCIGRGFSSPGAGLFLLLSCLAALLFPVSSPAEEPPLVTILYSSDELGYLEPCG